MATGLPTGVGAGNQEWVLDFSNIREAWQLLDGKPDVESVYIAHPDTGYTDHPELDTKNYIKNPKIAENCQKPGFYAKDDLISGIGSFPSHGTSTASVIVSPRGSRSVLIDKPEDARFAANSVKAFVTGVAPKSVLIPFKVTSSVLLMDATDEAICKAIYSSIRLKKSEHAINVGVMSISLGRPKFFFEAKLNNALKAARDNGIIVIAAAGQAFSWPPLAPTFPGSSEHTICVAACDSSGQKLSTGFYGPEVDISAPGVDVWRAESFRKSRFSPPSYQVNPSTGSSYATAITAGACALWLAYHGRENLIGEYGSKLMLTLFRRCVTGSADAPTGWVDDERGSGILDVEKLLSYKLPKKEEL